MSSVLKFSKKFAFPLWRWYLTGILALALTNFVSLQIPLLAKTIINALQDSKNLGEYQNTALLIIALGVLMILIRAISRIFIFYPGRRLEETSKSYLFHRLMHVSQSFYDKFGMGEIISRLANDIGQLRAFFAFGFLQMLNLIFLLAFTISKMLTIHTTLTLYCLSPLIFMIFLTRFMMTYMHRFSIENQEAIGRLTNKVTEAFVNVHVIKANSAEQTFVDISEVENHAVFVTNLKNVFLRTLLFPLLATLMNASQVIVIFYGGYEVIQGRLTIGDILAFNVYIAYLGFPLSAFGIIISLYQRSKAALDRIEKIENEPLEDARFPAEAATEGPLLEVKDLDFSFGAEDGRLEATLSNISLSLEAGAHVGIYGPIGSGKSTLFNLITRLIEPPKGTVFYNGQDVLSMKPQALRKKIGYAQQSVHLFSDSIANNLKFGLDDISQEQLEAAARGSQILDEIDHFDNGWETEIGEKGIRISGGQKQRLALARVFLRKPSLLLLDDVLSAVDQSTEKKLIEYIKATKSAMLVASHRASVLEHCDEILILKDGVIVDRGSYTELGKYFSEDHEQ